MLLVCLDVGGLLIVHGYLRFRIKDRLLILSTIVWVSYFILLL